LVCFKAGPDFEQIVDADWERFSLSTDLSYVRRIFGCFDETALETALRLRDALKEQGKDTVCGAITLSPLPSPLCKTLFALGFDDLWAAPFLPVEGAPERNLEFHPVETARALAEIIGTERWDLILAGRQAGYADTGMVPLLLAEKLRLPVINGAERIGPCGGPETDRRMEIERSGEQGREHLIVALPALVVMGNSPVSALRAATLTAQMQAAGRKAAIPAHSAGRENQEVSANALRLIREKRRKSCRFLPGEKDFLAQSVREIHEGLRAWGKS
jgi:electron transfer flavoprotein beta subunit